jgi:hypothetical protein
MTKSNNSGQLIRKLEAAFVIKRLECYDFIDLLDDKIQ